MVSIQGSDGRAAALLRLVPRAAEIQYWPRWVQARPEAFRAAARALDLAAGACAVDDGVPLDDRYGMYDKLLEAARHCGRTQGLHDTTRQVKVGKVWLAGWIAAEFAWAQCEFNNRYPLAGSLRWVINDLWGTGRALDLESAGPPADLRFSCTQLARQLRDSDVPDPAVFRIIAVTAQAFLDTGQSATTAHAGLAQALVDAGRDYDLTRAGIGRGGPGVPYLADAVTSVLTAANR